MAQITNISNSADSTRKVPSTTPSDDEDDADDHHQFLTPSSDIDSSLTNGVVTPHTVIKIKNDDDDDSISVDDLSYTLQPPSTVTTTLNTPQLQHTYLNLSQTNSETSLVQPLLSEQLQTSSPSASPINNDDERTASSASSTISSTSTTGSTVPYCRSHMTVYITDMLISAFIITPFVNIHWRGAWDLLDIHLLPDYPLYSALVTIGIGYFMLYTMYLTQGYLQRFYETHRHNLMGQIMTRLYTLLLALAYINQWRGLWNLLDLTSNTWYHLLAESLISIVFLLFMKSIYNLSSAPFIVGVDTESYFLLDSKYTVTTNRFCQYTFDFFYYELFEAPLLIITWRGIYNLCDLYIYPDNRQLSMIISFASGYLVYFLLALIQIPVVRCLIKLQRPLLHSIVTNVFHLIAFLSVVQIWRSLWIVCEQYLNIPEYHGTTLWLCYGVSFVVLSCGLAACSLNGPGGSKDSYIDDAPILLFKFDYFSTLLKYRSSYSKVDKLVSVSSDISSTEVIIAIERPYRLEPP